MVLQPRYSQWLGRDGNLAGNFPMTSGTERVHIPRSVAVFWHDAIHLGWKLVVSAKLTGLRGYPAVQLAAIARSASGSGDTLLVVDVAQPLGFVWPFTIWQGTNSEWFGCEMAHMAIPAATIWFASRLRCVAEFFATVKTRMDYAFDATASLAPAFLAKVLSVRNDSAAYSACVSCPRHRHSFGATDTDMVRHAAGYASA